MSRAGAAALLAACVLATGCGGGASADEVLGDTAERLGEIRSGTLAFSLTLAGRDGASGGVAGFELRGPFSLEGPGPFPVARLDYTQIAGDERATVTLVSTGDRAVVEVDGQAYALSDAQAAPLREALSTIRDDGAGGLVPLDDWIEEPELSDGGAVDGTPTYRVRSRLDVVQAVNGLSALAAGAGLSGDAAPAVAGADAELLQRSVRAAELDLRTGREDRLLRRLAVTLEFAAAPPPALQAQLGPLVGLRFQLALGIDGVNRPVSVELPSDVLPASAVPSLAVP